MQTIVLFQQIWLKDVKNSCLMLFSTFHYHRCRHKEVPWQQCSQAKNEEYDRDQAAARQKRQHDSKCLLAIHSFSPIKKNLRNVKISLFFLLHSMILWIEQRQNQVWNKLFFCAFYLNNDHMQNKPTGKFSKCIKPLQVGLLFVIFNWINHLSSIYPSC